jgi:hypothetical protein
LFGHAVPLTTFNTIRSYTSNTDYVQGNSLKTSTNSVILLDPFGTVTPIGATGFRTTYVLPGPPTTPDAMTIIVDVNVNGTAFEDSSIEVTTTVINDGDAPVDIGIRYLWDYQIGRDDGPTFQAIKPDGTVRVSEVEFPEPGFESYRIVDNDVNPEPPTFVVFGTTTGPTTLNPPPSAPDLLQYVSWPDAFVTAFEYDVATSGGSVNDSAVNYFFGPDSSSAITIPPQSEHTVSASVFAAPVVECSLSPDTATSPVGSNHTVTASVTSDGSPVSDRSVTFTIVSGPNAGTTAADTTDSNGQASFTYTGSGGPGNDTIEARGTLGLIPFSCTAIQTWTEDVTVTPTATDTPAATPTPTPTPASSPSHGNYNLTAAVFLDYRCDGVFQDGPDIPLAGVPVTLTFPDGSSIVHRTTRWGVVNFAGFDASAGLIISVDLPMSYRGYGLGNCANSPTSINLVRADFNAFRYHSVPFGVAVTRELAGP